MCRHGPGNAVALRQFAVELQQHFAVCQGFHTFGNNLVMECGGQSQYALQNGQIIRAIEHTSHKSLVDLGAGDRQAFQVG